jgi:hypothetical protein
MPTSSWINYWVLYLPRNAPSELALSHLSKLEYWYWCLNEKNNLSARELTVGVWQYVAEYKDKHFTKASAIDYYSIMPEHNEGIDQANIITCTHTRKATAKALATASVTNATSHRKQKHASDDSESAPGEEFVEQGM